MPDPVQPKLSWFQRHPLLSAAVVSAVVATLAFWIAARQEPELRKILQTAATTLLLGAFIGGLVRVLLEDLQQTREHRAEQARFVTAVLADLKSVYDRVERVRIVTSAHQSALTYGNEMRDVIDARVQLRNVVRAIGNGIGIQPDVRCDVRKAVERMERYLASLTDEFQVRYKAIADKQAEYEAIKKKALGSERPALPREPNRAWEELRTFEKLQEFLGERQNEPDRTRQGGQELTYRADFEAPLDLASWLLRGELRLLLGSRGEPMPKKHVNTQKRLADAADTEP